MVVQLNWPDCANARDLGGTRLGSGGVLAEGLLTRSDTLDRLTPAGRKALTELPIAIILDLRSDWDPHPEDGTLTELRGYRAIPWIDEIRDRERVPESEKTMADMYCGSLRRNVAQIGKIASAIAEADPGTIVVHCHSGQDRTGMLIALLLDLLGAPRQEITADYLLSIPNLKALPTAVGTPRLAGPRRLRPTSSTIGEALAFVDREYGGTRRYLKGACGLSAVTLERAEGRFVSA